MSPAALGHLAMLAFSGLVAGSFALGVLAANHIDPAVLNAVRFWIGAAIVGAIVLGSGKFRRSSFKAPWRYPLLAFPFVVYFVLMFEGLKSAPPVSAAAVFTLTPILSAGFGWILLRQVATARILLALFIGGLGALWVIFRADVAAIFAFEIGRGEWIYFWGCVAHAIYTPLVARLNRGESAGEFTFLMMVAGAVMLTLWSAPDLLATEWAALPGIVWVTILYTAIFASATTFTLLQFAALRLPSSKVMAYTYLTPTWVIVWTMLMGQDAPPVMILWGIGLTLLALGLLLRNEGERRGPPQSAESS